MIPFVQVQEVEGYGQLLHTALTGCPGLTELTIMDWAVGDDVDVALHRLLLPPHLSLPSLKELVLINVVGGDSGFLSFHPSLPALESLSLGGIYRGTIRPLGLALPHMPALRSAS